MNIHLNFKTGSRVLSWLFLLTLCCSTAVASEKNDVPWVNGPLTISEDGHFLKHENGTPFFWLGETAWLLPQRLNRDEVESDLDFIVKEAGKHGLQGNQVLAQPLNAPGFAQMQYLKKIILTFPYFERTPDQQTITSKKRYETNMLLHNTQKNDNNSSNMKFHTTIKKQIIIV